MCNTHPDYHGPCSYQDFYRPPLLPEVRDCVCSLLLHVRLSRPRELALLVVLVPYGLLVFSEARHAQDYLFLSLVGTYSLFPLLFQLQELVIKICIFTMVHCLLYTLLKYRHPQLRFGQLEKVYLAGILPHFCVVEVLLPVFLPHLQFLPLLLTSVYCGLGVVYAFCRIYLTVVQFR